METIKIAHLYYDVMNLYGEIGNVLALVHHLEENHVKVITHFLTIDDDIDFDKYDLFYIGSGNKESFELTRNDILKRKEAIKKAIQKKKFFLVTGNALDLFGKSYITKEQKELETLNILKFQSTEIDFRIVGDTYATFQDLKEIISFQNRFSVIRDCEEKALFSIQKGTGYVPKSEKEGIIHLNFYGTYFLGPLLIRNPHFTEYLIKEILKTKKIIYQGYKLDYEEKAYDEYRKRIESEEDNTK